uniref:Splicing factor 3B subunit 2-like n=1 Tax=Lepisosteus oculatus TaxID=7918 RepID=W5LVD3_LEPOC|nr:PREDICTED: splicing factor 3B subunit 2-like [Lepisosteus oculatus]
MPVGPNSHKVPPPWLIAMQRYGPPPSYPNLKIPGLNSPIPEVSWGVRETGSCMPPPGVVLGRDVCPVLPGRAAPR